MMDTKKKQEIYIQKIIYRVKFMKVKGRNGNKVAVVNDVK